MRLTLYCGCSSSSRRRRYDKIWDDHVVTQDDSSALIYIDRHLVHEVRMCVRMCVMT